MFILNRDEEIVAVLSGNSDDSGCHFFNAILTLELNKGASLTFEIDSTESDVVKYVKEENMVVVHDGENYRLLIIKEVSDIHEDSCMKEVYCEDASAELIDEIIYDEITGKVEMGIVLASILNGTRWEVGEVDNTYIRTLKSEYKLRTVLNGIQTLANDYDAEIDFTVEFAGNKIVARKVHMKQAFGRTLGKRFEFGKDVTSIKRTVNTADIKTAIVPFGATNEETGEVLTIKDVSWSKPTNPFNKPLGQTYIEDEEATELWGYKGTDSKRRARWIAITFEDCTDANELINYAQLQLNRFNKPKISYEAEVIDLYRMMEDESYSYEKVGLGDLANIIDHEFVPALTLQSRVVKLELDLNDTSNSKVTLGTVVESIVDKDLKTQIEELNVKVSAVASNVDLSDIEDRLDSLESETGTGRWEQIQEVNNLLFSNAVGYHYMDADKGIWVFDKPVNEKPTKAVALKGGMIGLAKYDAQKQQWNVGTFIDGNSVNASMINTGTLKAERIETGALTVAHFNQELKTIINSVGDKASRTEVTTAIKTAVDEINLSVSTKYSTKTETSSAVSTAKSEAVESAVQSAKSYADTKKAEAIAEAVEDASAYADTKADAVKNALTPLINDKASKTDVYTKTETYTKAQTDSAIKVAKESIELGVSSTYETKENVTSAITSAIDTSKSYADTKKSEAITQAGKDADSKVSAAKTELTGKIDLKASKTDVYNKTETYTKTETDSKIKVAKDEINLSVSNNYETKTNVENKLSNVTATLTNKIDGIQIGGRNLLPGTKDWKYGQGSGTIATETYEDCKVLYKDNSSGTNYVDIASWNDVITVKPNTEYTLSFYAKGKGSFTSYFYPSNVASGYSSEGVKTSSIDGNTQHTLTSEWKRYWITWKTLSNASGNKHIIAMRLWKGSIGYICGVKFEEGNKSSSYSEAPEDVQASIDLKAEKTDVYSKSEVYTKSQTDSAINVAKDSINLGVSQTYETKTNVTSKVNTAKTEAVNSAVATSKSYADTKKAEAISTASTDATNKVNSAKTELNTAINKKANSTDVYTKSETYTKSQTDSAIKVAKDEINLGVKNTYETKTNVESKISTAVNNVQIGGRNFFTNSDFKKTTSVSGTTNKNPNLYPWGWGGYNGGISNPTTNYHAHIDSTTFGYNVVEFNESDGTRHWKGIDCSVKDRVTQFNTYIISLDAYTTLKGANLYGGFYYYKKGATSPSFASGQFSISSAIPVGKWGRCSAKVPLNDDVDFTKNISFYIYGYGFSSNAICYIKNVKLEIGNKATDWTPAPEDIDSAIDSKANSTDVYKKSETYTKTETDSKISVAKNDITLSVSNTYETKTNVTSKINTAKTEAINTSKSYADVKKTEAINSASADATSKVNSAKTELNNSINTKANKTDVYTKSETYTKTETDSKISVAKDSINLGVSKVEQIATSSLQGKMLFTDPTFKNGTNGIAVYNNLGNGTVILSRPTKSSDCPTTSSHMIQITTNGTATPGHGGFCWQNMSRASAIFVTKIIAKIPSGCTLNWASNATGTGGKSEWLTSNTGTGNWKEYIFKVTCGSSGSFSSTNYFYLSGGSAPVTWYLAFATVFDITDTSNIESRMESAETKITPSAILSSVNTQIGNGGQINTVSTVLDKTGFTVKNGAIKVQNKAGTTVLSGDSNGNLVFTGTAKSQSGAQWVGLDSGGITLQDSQKNEQMLRIGTSYFTSNRDMNGVTLAMPQYSDFLRVAHIAKADLTNGWSSSDTQYNFFDCWSSDQTVGGVSYKKGINIYSPMLVNNGIQLFSGTNYPSEILGAVSWDNGNGTIWNMMGLYGDNGAVLGYKNGSNLNARILVTEGAHPGTDDRIRSWGHWNCSGYVVHNATFRGAFQNSYANTLTRTVVDTSCIESEIKQVRVIYEDKQLVDGKLILNIPKKYVGNNEGFIVSGIVKKGKGDVWVSEESENRFILEGTDNITVNVEVIIKMPVSSLNTLSCKNESAPTIQVSPFKEDVSEVLIK